MRRATVHRLAARTAVLLLGLQAAAIASAALWFLPGWLQGFGRGDRSAGEVEAEILRVVAVGAVVAPRAPGRAGRSADPSASNAGRSARRRGAWCWRPGCWRSGSTPASRGTVALATVTLLCIALCIAMGVPLKHTGRRR